jgi:hypothetical protein
MNFADLNGCEPRGQAWFAAHPGHRSGGASVSGAVETEFPYKRYDLLAQPAMPGAGNGALLPGRSHSSFVFTPSWTGRPWPPRQKYVREASDEEIGLPA